MNLDEGIANTTTDSQRASNKLSKPTYSKEVADAVAEICERLDLPEFRTSETAIPNHRRLCLYTCGLGLRSQSLEILVKNLVERGQNTKAAAISIIHGQTKLALQALRGNGASPVHRELSLALAGYQRGTVDDAWEETIRDLADHLNDPYARAILALVRPGNWHEVLAETSLPLRDRLGVALMYLDDTELTQYVHTNMTECIEEGDIEGIALTGLTEQAVPLFENYIQKSNDLQTAVLAMSFTCPRYFSDARIDLWRNTYRSYLNGWRMFIERGRFDVEATRLSAGPNQSPELRPASRQVSLRCTYCDQSLDRDKSNVPPPTSAAIFGTHPDKIFGIEKTGTVCPKCGRHMPRCVICMEWLGMPDPHTRGGVAAGMTKESSISRFVSVCYTCWHMSHSGHATEWFARHQVCPVPGCSCRCVEIDYGRA